MADVQAGWYPDGSGSERYWDGSQWTEQSRSLEAVPAPPPLVTPVDTSGVSASQTARNGLGTSALVLGIVGLIVALIPIIFGLGGFLGLLAFIFGLVGWSRARKGRATNKGIALTGTILGFIAIVAAVVNFVITVALVGSAVNSVNNAISSTTSTPGPSASCTGVQYPDQQSLDVCADSTGTVDLKGVKVTASSLTRTTDSLGSKVICDNVTLVNNTAATVNYSEIDYKLQPPSGAILDSTLGGSLGSGALIAGGNKTGQVCFADTGSETGSFVLIYKPGLLDDSRGIWLGSL